MVVIIPPAIEISIVDSKDDQKAAFVILDGKCKIKIQKKDLDNKEELVDKILDTCGYK